LRSQAQRRSSAIHRHIPRADHRDAFSDVGKAATLRPKIGLFEELYPLPHAGEILTGYLKVSGDTCSNRQKNRVIACTKQLVQLLNPMIAPYLDTILRNHPDLLIEDLAREPVRRDPYPQLPAGHCLRFKDGDLVPAPLAEVVGRGQPRRAGTYDRHPSPRGRSDRLAPMLPPDSRVPLNRGALDGVDRHRSLPECAATDALARPVTDVAANRRERYPLAHHCGRLPESPQRHVPDVARDIDPSGTA